MVDAKVSNGILHDVSEILKFAQIFIAWECMILRTICWKVIICLYFGDNQVVINATIYWEGSVKFLKFWILGQRMFWETSDFENWWIRVSVVRWYHTNM